MASAPNLSELRKAFELFDKNKDGTINLHELGDVMKSLGRDPTTEELQDIIDNYDVDGNKVVDFEEFLKLMGELPAENMTELRHVFAIFDKNGDGYISKSEMKSAMKKINENFNDEEIDDIIKEADLDDDGEVNFNEFVVLMTPKM